MKQLHHFYNIFVNLKCYPQCGVNSHILVSSLCSRMKREKSSPKQPFISRHNESLLKAAPARVGYTSPSVLAALSGRVFLQSVPHPLAAGTVHLLNVPLK